MNIASSELFSSTAKAGDTILETPRRNYTVIFYFDTPASAIFIIRYEGK